MEDEKDLEKDKNPGEDNKDKTPDEIREEIKAELEREKQAEIDRRVSDAIKKREEKLKKEQEDKDRLAKMTADERIKEKERVIEERELQLTLRDVLRENGLDEGLNKVFSVSKYVGAEGKEEALKADILTFKSYVDNEVQRQVEVFKADILKGTTPPSVSGDKKVEAGTITKEQFNKLSYKDRVELMNTNKELYNQLSKA